MRYFTAAALLAFAIPLTATAKDLLPKDFEVGQVGYMAQGSMPYRYDLEQIIDDNQMIMLLRGNPNNPFIVKGLSTKNRAEGQVFPLPGLWRITGTSKHLGRTYFVAEPEKAKDKK